MNTPSFWRRIFRFIVVAMLLNSAFSSRAQYDGTNGIFAEFNTSMGSFTSRLEYVLAPKTVANFIGLATGQRAWLDEASGLVKTNSYFNGTTFHRVIADFMNQGGSPNGQGTDGPGYVFPDEFSPSLRHDSFGVLSAANSGPDSNGAQYFITAAPTGWLDDVHSVFGKLYGGSNVVYAINQVATSASKPLTDVVVQDITIRRIGAAAQAFDIQAQGLPVVNNLNVQFAQVETNLSLTFSNRLYADTRLYDSPDLLGWFGTELGIETALPVAAGGVSRAMNEEARFFRMVQVQYPASTLAPKTLWNRTLALRMFNPAGAVTNDWGTITVTFDAAGSGSYTDSLAPENPPGTVNSYVWVPQPYRGYLWPLSLSGNPAMYLRLDFTNSTAGNIANGQWFNVSFFGSFTLTGP